MQKIVRADVYPALPATGLGVSHALYHLILIAILMKQASHYPHSSDGETEACNSLRDTGSIDGGVRI